MTTPRLISISVGLISICLGTSASAGLRPAYGGELVVTVPTAPVENDPALAWTVSELVQAQATGDSLTTLSPPPVALAGGKGWRFTLDERAGVEPKAVAERLSIAIKRATVALPSMQVRFESPRDVVVETSLNANELASVLALPWLRIAQLGPFASRRGVLEPEPTAPSGRAFVDRIRFEVKDGRRVEPAPGGIALGREGDGGRPVFALPKRGSAGFAALSNVLASLDRANVARLFVRGHTQVPGGWFVPASASVPTIREPLVIAVDAGERDLRTVAERIQILLRDRKVPARIVAEDRNAWRSRIESGDYDLALVPLPPAPEPIQAATLLRLAGSNAAPTTLKKAAEQGGAVLLYVEGGGMTVGARVRGVPRRPVWSLDLADAWLVPPGLAP